MGGNGHERNLVSLGAKGCSSFFDLRTAGGLINGAPKNTKDLLFEGTVQSDILRHQRNFLNAVRSAAT